MNLLLGLLLIFLGVSLWTVSGLLPILKLERRADKTANISLQLTWMGVLILWQRAVESVKGARLGRDPADPQQPQVHVSTSDGWVTLISSSTPLTTPSAHLAQVIDRFARDPQLPATRLPLRGRMSLMLGFAMLFPLGTVALLVGAMLIAR